MTKIEEQVNAIISNKNNTKMQVLLAQTDCRHEWKPLGKGYQCKKEKCGYYTGTDNELNKLIKEFVPAPASVDKDDDDGC